MRPAGAGLARPPGIPSQCFLRRRAEVVTNEAETARTREFYVPCALLDGGVRVVHDEGLFGFYAGPQEDPLPVAGLEHVKIYPEVGIEESLTVERGLSGRLNTDEDDRLHAVANEESAAF